MKQIATGLILSAIAATTVSAETIVEIRHTSFQESAGRGIAYWCIEKDQIPAEYAGSYSVMDVPTGLNDSGTMIATVGDRWIFLTTEACLDDTIAAWAAFGGTIDDLAITRK